MKTDSIKEIINEAIKIDGEDGYNKGGVRYMKTNRHSKIQVKCRELIEQLQTENSITPSEDNFDEIFVESTLLGGKYYDYSTDEIAELLLYAKT